MEFLPLFKLLPVELDGTLMAHVIPLASRDDLSLKFFTKCRFLAKNTLPESRFELISLLCGSVFPATSVLGREGSRAIPYLDPVHWFTHVVMYAGELLHSLFELLHLGRCPFDFIRFCLKLEGTGMEACLTLVGPSGALLRRIYFT